jgi:hypothetical protein
MPALEHTPADAGAALPVIPVCYPLSLTPPSRRLALPPQGFDNVNNILTANGAYAPGLLVQIVVLKVIATAICRGSGLQVNILNTFYRIEPRMLL